MFDNPVVKQVGRDHWVASTPVLFSKHLREYSWGGVQPSQHFLPRLQFMPVVPDGLGLAYITALTIQWHTCLLSLCVVQRST